MEFIIDNIGEIVAALFAVHAAATAIINITDTPSKRASKVLRYSYKVLEVLGGMVSDKAKGKG